MCVCVCLCVCVKAKCVDMSARIATKLHTRTNNLPDKVLKRISISWTYQKGRFSIARMGRSHCYGSGQELQKCKNAVKRNLSSTHFHQPYVVLKLSIKEAQICSSGRIGDKTTKIWPSKLLGLELRIFRSTSVKHSRLAGTTIFLQRSYTTRMALESSRLAELKHAISAAWDVRKKTYGFR